MPSVRGVSTPEGSGRGQDARCPTTGGAPDAELPVEDPSVDARASRVTRGGAQPGQPSSSAQDAAQRRIGGLGGEGRFEGALAGAVEVVGAVAVVVDPVDHHDRLAAPDRARDLAAGAGVPLVVDLAHRGGREPVDREKALSAGVTPPGERDPDGAVRRYALERGE